MYSYGLKQAVQHGFHAGEKGESKGIGDGDEDDRAILMCFG